MNETKSSAVKSENQGISPQDPTSVMPGIESSSERKEISLFPHSRPFALAEIKPKSDANSSRLEQSKLKSLMDEVELEIQIQLGNTTMKLDEFLHLRNGAVITLNQGVTEPVDILANSKLIARGEVVLIDEQICVRVTEIVGI